MPYILIASQVPHSVFAGGKYRNKLYVILQAKSLSKELIKSVKNHSVTGWQAWLSAHKHQHWANTRDTMATTLDDENTIRKWSSVTV